jgi:hypothetical protein
MSLMISGLESLPPAKKELNLDLMRRDSETELNLTENEAGELAERPVTL